MCKTFNSNLYISKKMVNGKWRMDWQRCIELNTEEALFVGQKWSFLTISWQKVHYSHVCIRRNHYYWWTTHTFVVLSQLRRKPSQFAPIPLHPLRNVSRVPIRRLRSTDKTICDYHGPHPIVYVVGAVVGAFVPTGAFVSRLCWWKNRLGSPVICKQIRCIIKSYHHSYQHPINLFVSSFYDMYFSTKIW